MTIKFENRHIFLAKKWGIPNCSQLTFGRVSNGVKKKLYVAFGEKHKNSIFLHHRLKDGTLYVIVKQLDVGVFEAQELIFEPD